MTKIKNFGQPKNIKQKGIRTIKRIAFESILMRWISLEPIIQSEVSQKEKDKYCILTHIYGIQKDDNDPTFRATKDTDVKNRLLDSVGEDEGRMI